MLWGGTSDYINPFVQSAKAGYATHAYGPNEYVNLIWVSLVSLS